MFSIVQVFLYYNGGLSAEVDSACAGVIKNNRARWKKPLVISSKKQSPTPYVVDMSPSFAGGFFDVQERRKVGKVEMSVLPPQGLVSDQSEPEGATKTETF